MAEAQAKSGGRRALVLVNARAGRVLQTGEAAFEAEIRTAFARHGIAADVEFTSPKALSQRFMAAIASEAEFVGVAGGDGTLGGLLSAIIRADRTIFTLPLGTMNLLGRDLGLTGDLSGDIDRIVGGVPRRVSLAEINGMLFHSNAGLGILGVMAREREQARRRFPFSRMFSFVVAALRTFFTAKRIHVDLDLPEGRRSLVTDALLITNNRFEGTPWHRARLDDGILEVHLLTAPGLWDRVRMLVATARGRWREHPLLTSFRTRALTIRRLDRERSTVAVDGEVVRMRGPLRVAVVSEACSFYGAPEAEKGRRD